MFFYSVDPQDLVIDPTSGRPRIGEYAPAVPAKGSTALTPKVIAGRNKTRTKFYDRLKDVVALAEQENQPSAGKIYFRWHYTDPKKPPFYDVINRDNTQAVRDLFTEYRVKYPNKFWVSCNAKDLDIKKIDGIFRPEQGPLLPTGVDTSTSSSTASAAASVSTAGTGQIHDPPLPTGQPATKKVKPSSTVSVAPGSPPATTTSGQNTLRTFYASFNPLTDSAPVDTGAPLSSAADPIPLIYLDLTTSSAHLIIPDSGITGIAPEETLQANNPAELTAQLIGALTADSHFSSGSLLETNDSSFSQEFLDFGAVPTGDTSSEETVHTIDASQLTVQPIGALTAASDFSSGSLPEANDPNEFLNLGALPTGGTAQEQPEEEDPGNEVVVFDRNEWFKGSDDNQ